MKKLSPTRQRSLRCCWSPPRLLAARWRGAGAEHRHRQRQGRAEGAGRSADGAGHAARASRARPSSKRRCATKSCCARSSLQEAEKRGLAATADYKAQMEFARQSILIRELFKDYQKKNPVTEAEMRAEYDKFKAQAAGTEIPRPPHPGREGRRGEGADRADQGRRQASRNWPRRTRRTRARAPTAATSTSPTRLLRARVRPGAGQAEEGRDDRDAGEDPVRLPHHQARGHRARRSSRRSTKSSRRSSSAWRS